MTTFDVATIIEEIPRMRRYAALLCLGDRHRGDRLVEIALIDLVEQPANQRLDSDCRLLLLQTMQQKIREKSSLVPGHDEAHGLGNFGDQRATRLSLDTTDSLRLLASLPIEQRSALLLGAVEELAVEEIARILKATTSIVSALLADAARYLNLNDRLQARAS